MKDMDLMVLLSLLCGKDGERKCVRLHRRAGV